MMLIEVLEVADEYKEVNVLLMGEVVSHYDGKDSIDEFYNDFKVIGISANNNTLEIEVI